MEALQNYWWLLISILGAVLVFLMFVLGGQSMLFGIKDEDDKSTVVTLMGHKWELVFTSLVVFGGAFFASFPLFYSTSFGGAYWLWMLILFSFIGQAVSYEYRSKPGNLLGTVTYDAFLFFNGVVGSILLGVAVSMFFFGAEFTVSRGNILDVSSPVISRWAPTHGFEAIFNWKNLILGVAVLFLSRTQACLYIMNRTTSESFFQKLRKCTLINGGIFVVFFVWFLVMLLVADGYKVLPNGQVTTEQCHYFFTYVHLWWALVALLLGVVMVLYGVFRSALASHFAGGIWWSGIGTFLVVCSLFWVAGYGDSAYYPSLLNPADSLTIRNSSSSEFTLTVMSYVSIIVPFVVAYIAYAWYSMDRKKKIGTV